MKKFIALFTVLLLAGLVVTAQNPFLREQSGVILKISTDRVGIGLPVATEKVKIGSVYGEGPLALKGFSSPYNPYITLYSSDDVAIWKLFANPNWFAIGNSRDTTTALLVGKFDNDWLKINGTLAATKVLAPTGSFTNLTGTTATITTLALTGNATTKTLTTAGDISATGTITSLGNLYCDASFYFGDDYTNAWRPWAVPETSMPFSRITLQNIGNISIQAKGSLSQVTAIERDTSGGTAKINLPNVNHLDVSDTTGIVLTSALGTKYRLFISSSGTVSVTVVP